MVSVVSPLNKIICFFGNNVLSIFVFFIRISPTGNFTMALDHLKEKTHHALFSLIKKHTNISRLLLFDTPSYYLDLTRKMNERKALLKFRIANHKLMFEIGRYMIKLQRIVDFALLVDL